MAARLKLTVRSPGLLLGVRKIEVLLDGEPVDAVQFGQTSSLEIAPGDHTAQIVLHAVFKRRSNVLAFRVADDEDRAISGKYSRLWGSLRIREA